MRHFFDPDSWFTQKLTLLGNLIIANVLWLIACVPIVTAGAASAALYDVMFRLRRGDDRVFAPFWRAFRQNFKQAVLLWIPLLMVFLLLGFNILYLTANGWGLLWIPVGVLLLLAVAVLTYGFPMIARYEMGLRAVVRSSISCFMLHLAKSLLMSLLNLFPAILLLAAPYLFFRGAMLWCAVWFSLTAYINSKFLLDIFGLYSRENPEETPLP